MTDRVLPEFKNAADQDEWFLQDGLRSRQNTIHIDDKRGYITVFPNYTGMSTVTGIDDDSFIVMIDDDLDATMDKIFKGLYNSGVKDGKFKVQYVISSAWGYNTMMGTGSTSPYSTQILDDIRQSLEDFKKIGLLKPKNIEYNTAILEKYAPVVG